MDRCPNCGAPARPGAKFCTTCGYRLPTVVPITTDDTPAESETTATSSWPAPPGATEPAPDTGASTGDTTVTESEVTATSEAVIEMPASTTAEAETAEVSETESSSTDSVLSSSWPSPATTAEPSPWSTTSTETTAEETEASTGESASGVADDIVTEEVVVVSEPASQYEGWSSAVVQEVSPDAEAHGTTIARAIALLDELRLLLPTLHGGAAGGSSETVVDALESALSTTDAAAGDRQGLRDALNEARDNPRDIQTILALSQQVDAAIALLDDHDRLVEAVRTAVTTLTPADSEQS